VELVARHHGVTVPNEDIFRSFGFELEYRDPLAVFSQFADVHIDRPYVEIIAASVGAVVDERRRLNVEPYTPSCQYQ